MDDEKQRRACYSAWLHGFCFGVVAGWIICRVIGLTLIEGAR